MTTAGTAAGGVLTRKLQRRHSLGPGLRSAKVVYRGNATRAVRETIGQLLTYRHVLYRGSPEPIMVALFSENVGDLYTGLRDSLGILSVSKTATGWTCSPSAKRTGL